MAGIFYGLGPNIRTGVAVQPVEDIEIYSLVADILSLTTQMPIDARGTLTTQIFQASKRTPPK